MSLPSMIERRLTSNTIWTAPPGNYTYFYRTTELAQLFHHNLGIRKMTEFNPLAILEGTTDREFTKSPALPVGDYIGVIAEFDREKAFRSGTQKSDPTKKWSAINVRIDVDLNQYPDARAVVNADRVSLFDMVMIDLTASGSLDYSTGKNNRLRRYREALGQNTPGVPWAPTHMQGRPVKVKIKHDPYGDEVQARVDAVSAP
jgi:hypothetical protein